MKKAHKIILGVVAILVVALIAIDSGVSTTSFSESASSLNSKLGIGGELSPQFAEESFMDSSRSGLAMGILPELPRGGDTAADVDQKIVKTGYLSLLVEEISSSVPGISEIATKHGGFTQYTNVGEYSTGERYGSITIRVPSESYDAAVSEIRALGLKVIGESSDAQDVTEQYTDLQTRLSVARDEEVAYLALLDRSGSVGDLLQVQRELSNVRVRIESLQGRIKYLDNQTNLSTITVTLEEETSISIPTKPFRFESIVRDAFQGAVSIAQGLLTAVVWIVILGVLVALPLWLIYQGGRKVWDRRKK